MLSSIPTGQWSEPIIAFKIKAVLKNDDKEQVEKMTNYIEVVKNPYLPQTHNTNNHIQTILECIVNYSITKNLVAIYLISTIKIKIDINLEIPWFNN